MRVRLTPWQVRMLQPYFDRVKATSAIGSPGMLVAQLSHDQNGTYALVPAFLDHDLAQVITEKGRDIPSDMRQKRTQKAEAT